MEKCEVKKRKNNGRDWIMLCIVNITSYSAVVLEK